MRKHLTEETGWVPAQYLKDDETYTMYVQRKLVEKIEKLPVFESKLLKLFLIVLTSNFKKNGNLGFCLCLFKKNIPFQQNQLM